MGRKKIWVLGLGLFCDPEQTPSLPGPQSAQSVIWVSDPKIAVFSVLRVHVQIIHRYNVTLYVILFI